MIFMFDAGREGNRVPIRKVLAAKEEGTENAPKEFFLHSVGTNKREKRSRGVGTAGDVECMFVAAHKPLFQIKKKPRTRYGGNTSSVLYNDVQKPGWKTCPQVTAQTKAFIFNSPPCPATNAESLDPAKWSSAKAKKKSKIPASARNLLPLNWHERHIDFFSELILNFNLGGVIDLFGSANLAIACISATPPRPYLALVRSELHASVLASAVDTYIAREMGRAGPPPSKWYIAEMKDVVAKH